jgi:hypothetical protein
MILKYNEFLLENSNIENFELLSFSDFLTERTEEEIQAAIAKTLDPLGNAEECTKELLKKYNDTNQKIGKEISDFLKEKTKLLIDNNIFNKDNYNKTLEEMGKSHAKNREGRRKDLGEVSVKFMGENDKRPPHYVFNPEDGLGNFFKLVRHDLSKFLEQKGYYLTELANLNSPIRFDLEESVKMLSQYLRDEFKNWLKLEGDKISLNEKALEKSVLNRFDPFIKDGSAKIIGYTKNEEKMFNDNVEKTLAIKVERIKKSQKEQEEKEKELEAIKNSTIFNKLKSSVKNLASKIGILEEEEE